MSTDICHVTVGELVDEGHGDIRTGPFGTQLRASDYTEFGVPVLNVRNLGYGVVREAHLEHVPDKVRERLATHLLEVGDIVFGRKGAVDRHVLIGPEQAGWMQGSDCIRLRLGLQSPVLPAFLSKLFLTNTHKQWMEAQCSHGATMASLNQEIIRRIPVDIPSPETQARVIDVLSSLDGLTVINERRIEILENLARSIYREWFVHLRFPDQDDSEFVGSAAGSIPANWSVPPLASVAKITMGQSPRSEFYNEIGSGLPFHQGVTSFGSFIPTHSKYCTAKMRTAEPSDVLCSVRAPVGRLNVADRKLGIGRGLSAIRRNDEAQAFLLLQLRQGLGEVDSIGGGTIYKAIGKSQLSDLPVVEPTPELVARFEAIARPMLELRVQATRLNRQLAIARDLLLPRLVTGQLDIADIDLGVLTAAESE
ncbi:MAG: restriction endonuclease subunit S [Solirubrobacterales bacterium]